MKTLITTIVIALTATFAQAETVSQKFLETEFSNNSTEAQRDFAWEDIEGKYTSVTGQVHDVDAPGWLIKEYSVTLKLSNGLDVYCKIPEAQASRVKKVRFNDQFTCEGKLSSYINLFGSSGISIRSDINVSANTIEDNSKIEAAKRLLRANGYSVMLKSKK
jgi:hypothetical protein